MYYSLALCWFFVPLGVGWPAAADWLSDVVCIMSAPAADPPAGNSSW